MEARLERDNTVDDRDRGTGDDGGGYNAQEEEEEEEGEYDDEDPYVYDDDIPRTVAEIQRATGLLQLSLSSSSQSSSTDYIGAGGQPQPPWTCQACGQAAGPSTPIFVLSSPGNGYGNPCTDQVLFCHDDG